MAAVSSVAEVNCHGQSLVHLSSFNMHGFNQGITTVDELISDFGADVVCVQEHWLTPDNLCNLNKWSEFMVFSTSAMLARVESGPLFGRPFGGLGVIVNKRLSHLCNLVYSSDRVMGVVIADIVLFSLYLPCAGTADRLSLCVELLNEMWSTTEQYPDKICVIGGDLNSDINFTDACGLAIRRFMREKNMTSCYDLFPSQKCSTYVNSALGHSSIIDYFLASEPTKVTSFSVIDPINNFSDHVPILCTVRMEGVCLQRKLTTATSDSGARTCSVLRWDHADLQCYYHNTQLALAPLLTRSDNLYANVNAYDTQCVRDEISSIVSDLSCVLTSCASVCVPRVTKSFYKFWWDTELDCLKGASVDAFNVWKAAGRPRFGELFDNKQRTRARYRLAIREKRRREDLAYTNDLHDALLQKDTTSFWRSWKSKFSTKTDLVVDGACEPREVLSNFQRHFSKLATASETDEAEALRAKFVDLTSDYEGNYCDPLNSIDVQMVYESIKTFERGKASDLDDISAEHLKFSHSSICVILCRLFNVMLYVGFVPENFCQSYTVPLLKNLDCRSRSVSCDDFRGIAISSILAKTFEKCLLAVFDEYFITEENQFGFKKGLSCRHAVYSAR